MGIFAKKDIRNEFLPSALEIVETPESPIGRLTIWLISFILISGIAWAVIGKVDETAISRGKVIPGGNLKILQSLEGGKVTSIAVKEGEKVKKDQILIKFDTTILESEKKKYENALNLARTEKGILYSILERKEYKIEENNPSISKELLQKEIEYKKIKEKEYSDKIQVVNINISKAEQELAMEKERAERYKAELDKAIEIEKKAKEDLDKELISKQEYEQKKSDIDLAKIKLTEQNGQVTIYQKNLELAKNEKSKNEVDYKKNITSEIITKDTNINELEKELEKINKRIEMQTILSPVDGVVQELATTTIGGIVAAGNPIISIVPNETEILIEATILNKDIGFVNIGQTVEVKFDAFPFQQYGTIKGEIAQISADAIKTDTEGYVYKSTIKLKSKSIKVNNKNVAITPGMTIVSEIKTGERRIIDFFIPGIKHVRDTFNLR